MKEKIILIGGGGHCHACIDVIELQDKYEIEGIIDVKEVLGTKIMGYPVIGNDDDIPRYAKTIKNFHISIGQIKSPEVRIRLYNTIKKAGGLFPVIISPLAYVSKHAKIGEGSIIMHHVVINAETKIGVNTIVNTKALIEHDVYIGNHCHISTGAIINSESQLGDNSFFGSNSVTVQDVLIPEDTFTKAHSIVRHE